MSVQKFLKSLVVVFCISLSAPAFSSAMAPASSLVTTPVEGTPKTADPMARLLEIKNMHLENLSRAEKRDLRKEVKGIRKQMRERKTGIYLSFGAIIIVILLLILLL